MINIYVYLWTVSIYSYPNHTVPYQDYGDEGLITDT